MSSPGGTLLILKDKHRNRIFLTLRGGVVVGAMGSEPARYLGLTEAAARLKAAGKKAK